MSKQCKGCRFETCRVYIGINNVGDRLFVDCPDAYSNDCPCQTCLVKVVCEKVCVYHHINMVNSYEYLEGKYKLIQTPLTAMRELRTYER